VGRRSVFVLLLGLAVACGGKSERILDEGEAGSQTVAGTGGAPGVGGSSPGAGGSIQPGTGGTPDPGTGGTPDPGTGGLPEPGTGAAPNPNTGGTDPGTGGTPDPGTGGTPDPGTGGTPDPGTGGTPDPGAGGSGNVGGTVPVGGSGPCAAPPIDPSCRGIATGNACVNAGLHCESLLCGLADSGRRTCDCRATWACSACDFTGSVYAERPGSISECTGFEQDRVACAVLGAVCLGAAAGEACACYLDDECNQVWDCDKPPPGWIPEL